MSYGMRSSDYFIKYEDKLSPPGRYGGGKRYGGESSFSQFRDREDRFRDSYSRPNSGNFGNRMGGGAGFGDRRSGGKGMQGYGMGYDDMRGRAEYNERIPRSPIMRGMKRNTSPDYGFGGRSQALGMSDTFTTEAALLSLGLQAKQFLDTQAAGYGPPAAKMRRLNEGYGRPMAQGHGMMRRGMARGGAARGRRGSPRAQNMSDQGQGRLMARGRGRGMARGGAARTRRGSTRVQKPREIPAWRKTPYHCNFCQKATKTREEHAQHLKTKEHRNAVKEREQKLVEQMYILHKRAQVNAERARQDGLLVRFCGICSLEYTGKVGPHKSSREHLAMMGLKHVKCQDCNITLPNRVQYERHNVTLLHIKNHIFNLIESNELAMSDEELECPEEYDENVTVGMQYINRKMAVYCKACEKYFPSKDMKVVDHCMSQEHYDNFKDFVVTRKAELEEKANKAKEAAAVKEEATDEVTVKTEADSEAEDDAEAVDGEAEDDAEAVDGEAEDDAEAVGGEAEDEEASDGEAEDVEEADGEAEDNKEEKEETPAEENEDVEMEELEEEEVPAKSPKKSPAAATRTTRKRSAKAK